MKKEAQNILHIAEVSTHVHWSVRMATLVVMVLHCSQEDEVKYTTSKLTKLKRKVYLNPVNFIPRLLGSVLARNCKPSGAKV